ncbi:CRISPR-associated endonuclease Cas2 [Candidatus Peribacteria bacterium RIFCSPLOWO2_01_FULL_51_18]|nr:MAG: CRISPR-associated endonuclease Cas2 [Candidatus Peribacteria bacterium RIFCSPLOWO2_01_FULL_51_18]
MLLVSYDITNDKTRTAFSKFLKKFGRRVQYSVYEIQNSPRVLRNIITVLEHTYRKKFGGADSVIIFQVCEGCRKRTLRFGYPSTESGDIVCV